MLTPYDNIKKTYYDIILQQRKDYKEDFKQAQEFIIWIVWFSVGSLYFLLSNLEKTQLEFGHFLIKIFIILLTTSIAFGAIYRLSITTYREYLRRTSFYLEGAFSPNNIMFVREKDIDSEVDIEIVLDKIKKDFGEDMSPIVSNYSILDIKSQQIILESLKKHYRQLAEWTQKDYEFGLQYVKTVFQKAFGMNEKSFNRIAKNDTVWWLKFWKSISLISFLLCCLSFVIVPVIICIIY